MLSCPLSVGGASSQGSNSYPADCGTDGWYCGGQGQEGEREEYWHRGGGEEEAFSGIVIVQNAQ